LSSSSSIPVFLDSSSMASFVSKWDIPVINRI
jgi:hypothetical protein